MNPENLGGEMPSTSNPEASKPRVDFGDMKKEAKEITDNIGESAKEFDPEAQTQKDKEEIKRLEKQLGIDSSESSLTGKANESEIDLNARRAEADSRSGEIPEENPETSAEDREVSNEEIDGALGKILDENLLNEVKGLDIDSKNELTDNLKLLFALQIEQNQRIIDLLQNLGSEELGTSPEEGEEEEEESFLKLILKFIKNFIKLAVKKGVRAIGEANKIAEAEQKNKEKAA